MKKVSAIHALLIASIICLTLTVSLHAFTTAQPYQAELDSEITANPIETTSTAKTPLVQSPKVANVEDDDSVAEEVAKPVEEKEETATPAENAAQAATDTETVSVNDSTPASPSTVPSCCEYYGTSSHSHDPLRFLSNGYVGRWVVPSVGIDVACYYYDEYFSDSHLVQQLTDAWDSAAFWPCGAQIVISDHSNQSFSSVKYITAGTTAYMDVGDYRQKFVCTKVVYGYNDNGILRDDNFNRIKDNGFNAGGITLQTCNGNSYNIILVCFQPVYD